MTSKIPMTRVEWGPNLGSSSDKNNENFRMTPQQNDESRHLCFIYTKVGNVRFKPRPVFTSWILRKQMHRSHSELKHFASGRSLVLQFWGLSKAARFYKNSLLLHTYSESKSKFQRIRQNLVHRATELFAHLLVLTQKLLLRTFEQIPCLRANSCVFQMRTFSDHLDLFPLLVCLPRKYTDGHAASGHCA